MADIYRYVLVSALDEEGPAEFDTLVAAQAAMGPGRKFTIVKRTYKHVASAMVYASTCEFCPHDPHPAGEQCMRMSQMATQPQPSDCPCMGEAEAPNIQPDHLRLAKALASAVHAPDIRCAPVCECWDTGCRNQPNHIVPAGLLHDEECGQPAVVPLLQVVMMPSIESRSGPVHFCEPCGHHALASNLFTLDRPTKEPST